ncbi:MAG TPA: hypothetical protein DGH68_01960, partial [Bacteroidetes bacterium]|nr:hypothetical protein [Bacteroidota bacterium]
LVFKPIDEVYKKTITNTITTLPTIPEGAMRCKIQVESADVRVKFNATTSTTYCATPTIGGGLILFQNTIANPYHLIEGVDAMVSMRLCRASASDAYINVIFEGEVPSVPVHTGGTA